MIENSLYINANNGKQLLTNIQIIANNLANVNTAAFHADYKNIIVANSSDDEERRKLIEQNSVFTDSKPGAITYTGRDLDLAIEGATGYITVQTQSGEVAYTRSGSLDITPQGLLVTRKGDIVLGTSGVITVPQSSKIEIDKNGVVYAQPPGEGSLAMAEVGRLKLVEAQPSELKKGNDGLYYQSGDMTPKPAVNVQLIPESLEGSNVNPIRCLTELIECSREFDMHTKLMREASENASKSNQLLDVLT